MVLISYISIPMGRSKDGIMQYCRIPLDDLVNKGGVIGKNRI